MQTLLETPVLSDFVIYVVTGANWTTEVSMDAHNAQFDLEHQVLEAGTRAIEVFKGLKDEPKLVLMPDARGEKPQIGTVMLVHLKGGDPSQSAIVFTHVCLANTGFYNDSMRMEALVQKQAQEIANKIAKDEAESKKPSNAQAQTNKLLVELQSKTFPTKKPVKEKQKIKKSPKIKKK